MNKRTIIFGIIVVLVASAIAAIFINGRGNTVNTVIKTIPASETPSIKIIAFGDSLTAGLGVSENEAYPAQLETALQAKGYSVSVINSGVSGETTRGSLERATFIKNQKAEIILLGIGGNDALRFLPVSEVRKNIRETIDILRSGTTQPTIALLQMQAPLNAGAQYKKEFDSLYSAIAKEKNLTLIPFITPELFLDQANKQADGIHYNSVGYKKVVDQYLVPAIETILKSRQSLNAGSN